MSMFSIELPSRPMPNWEEDAPDPLCYENSWKVVDNIVYLEEDNIPVRCLYVSASGMKNCRNLKQKLTTHFTNEVGPVEHIKVFNEKKETKETDRPLTMKEIQQIVFSKTAEETFAHVFLKNYVDVHRAIGHNVLINLDGVQTYCRIVPVYPWLQPKCMSRLPGAHVFDVTKPTLEYLNDDCILHIMQFLNVLEVTALRNVSSRFDALAQILAKSKFTEVDLDQVVDGTPVSLMTALNVIEYIGPVVKKLCINMRLFPAKNYMILVYMNKHCKVLEAFDVKRFDLNSKTKEKMINIMKQLKSFVLRDSICDNREYENIFKCANNLHAIEIISCPNFNGRALLKLNRLKLLRLHECCQLQPLALISGFKKWKNTLKVLDITSQMHYDVIKTIGKDLHALEELTITDNRNLSEIGKCKKLQKLTIKSGTAPSVNSLLEVFVEHNQLNVLDISDSPELFKDLQIIENLSRLASLKNLICLPKVRNETILNADIRYLRLLTQLESLSIPGASSVRPDTFLTVIKACPSIKFLDISFSCIENDFIRDVLEVQKNLNRPKLELVVTDTLVDPFLLEVDLLKQNYNTKVTLTFS